VLGIAYDLAQQNHWSERGQATSVANADALGRPRRSVLALGGIRTHMRQHLNQNKKAEGPLGIRNGVWFFGICSMLLCLLIISRHRPDETTGQIAWLSSFGGVRYVRVFSVLSGTPWLFFTTETQGGRAAIKGAGLWPTAHPQRPESGEGVRIVLRLSTCPPAATGAAHTVAVRKIVAAREEFRR